MCSRCSRWGCTPGRVSLRCAWKGSPHAPFVSAQNRRAEVVAWAQAVVPSEVDTVLTRLAAVALRDVQLPKPCTWQASQEEDLQCHQVFDSEHPYRPCTDSFQRISFPGAPYMTLRFDQRTHTESVQDYVTIFTDDTCVGCKCGAAGVV